MTQKDPRVIKTLRSIDAALIHYLKNTPFSKITLEMICLEAMINKTTFYKYYQDKYDLLDNFLKRTLDEFQEHADVAFIKSDSEHIRDEEYRRRFRDFSTFMFEKKDLYLILWNAKIDTNVYLEMKAALHKAMLKELDISDIESKRKIYHIDLHLHLLASNAMSVFYWWFNHDTSVPIEDVTNIMEGIMKLGLFHSYRYLMSMDLNDIPDPDANFSKIMFH